MTNQFDPFDVLVQLTGETLEHLNTLIMPPEEREIVIAQGKQFRNGDPSMVWSVPEVFRLPGAERAELSFTDDDGNVHKMSEFNPGLATLDPIPIEDGPNGTFTFFNQTQGVRFTIRVVNQKDEFVKALLTPGIQVVYAGHARFGRGPCFGGGGDSTGEMWEEGTTAGHPNQDGIFRMGFPFIAVPAHDPIEHGYTANLLAADVRPKAADCDPELRDRLGGLRAQTLDEINPELINHVRDPDPAKKFWVLGKKKDPDVVMIAGWENTLSAPDDIGAITPLCRSFVHMACSTFRHNHPVVRKLKKWTHQGDERYAYWTTNLSTAIGDHYWIQHLLTYDQFNAFQPLEKSLEFSKDKSNALLRKDGELFRFI